jgi:EAL domain-containing protein (putative c-di-GMP-specific phosphodiesterase class I)
MEIDHISPMLQELKLLGIRISIDDFGVGYSSLSLLQNLTIDNIKIDKSFISGVLINPKAAAIVKTTISMCENLDFGIIAEGVETNEQLHFLKQNNCHIGQGYFFSIPSPADDFEKFLADYAARTQQYSLIIVNKQDIIGSWFKKYLR